MFPGTVARRLIAQVGIFFSVFWKLGSRFIRMFFRSLAGRFVMLFYLEYN